MNLIIIFHLISIFMNIVFVILIDGRIKAIVAYGIPKHKDLLSL